MKKSKVQNTRNSRLRWWTGRQEGKSLCKCINYLWKETQETSNGSHLLMARGEGKKRIFPGEFLHLWKGWEWSNDEIVFLLSLPQRTLILTTTHGQECLCGNLGVQQRSSITHLVEKPQTGCTEEKFYATGAQEAAGRIAAGGLGKHQRDLDPTDCTADIRETAHALPVGPLNWSMGIPCAVHASPTHPRPPRGWLPVDAHEDWEWVSEGG